ncbi:hypothetical protein L596_024608 [Steinernema carpocapsae]|uniref:Uncharacterized protein n=1 Tax=Steinernema carpocapsae TaxID=34508 RepID=A0A4U5M593_STECR|nr:hypothetical protein L596_024608 [Steinernema carpocapsae]
MEGILYPTEYEPEKLTSRRRIDVWGVPLEEPHSPRLLLPRSDFQKPAFWPWASGTREPRSWTYKQLKEFDISEQKVIDKNPERPEIAKNRAKNEIPTITGAKYVLVAVELSIVGIAACCYCAAKNANIPQNSAQGHDMRGRASEGSYRPHQPDNSSQRFYEAFDV